MDHQREAVERLVENQQRTQEKQERIRAESVATMRRSMDRGAESAHNNAEPVEQRRQTDSGRKREASEAFNTRSERLYTSPDQVALLRTREPSELREDASRAWAPIHRRNFEEYVRAAADGKLEHGQAEQRLVHPDQIARVALTSPERHEDTPAFWNHHGNDAAHYRNMAEKYSALQEQLRQGKNIEELRRDPDFKQAADFWYSSSDPVRLTEFKNSYLGEGKGDHRIALAHRYQLESIPAEVRQARYRDSAQRVNNLS